MTPRVATVAGDPIPVTRLEDRMADLRRGPRGRQMVPPDSPGYLDLCRWVVRELVTEAVLAHEMTARGLADAGRLAADITAGVTVTDDEVRSYFARNPDLYQRPDGAIPFEEARASIERELLGAARIRAFDDWLEQRRQELVVVEPRFEHPAHPIHGLLSHRH